MEIIFLTIILGGTILLAIYIGKIFKTNPEETFTENVEEEQKLQDEKPVPAAKPKKKLVDKKIKEKAATFKHPWLLTSLKGHSGKVVDMDISPNGKHLASCSEVRLYRIIWTAVI